MAKSQQLIDVAKDYFYFVTKFFAVINVSAPHIYHSALALSPQSSIIREHYHCQPFNAKPRVVCGLPGTWDRTTILYDHYMSYTWSPCGQSFSTLSYDFSVEEWDATTLEKYPNLQPCAAGKAEQCEHGYFPGALAYSPDGHSLACFIGSIIVIWDLQTGGVVEEIETNVPQVYRLHTLVWSSDGIMIYAPSKVEGGAWTVTAYNITSGKEAYRSMVQSLVEPHLWLHYTSLRVMVYDTNSQDAINILEVQPNSTNTLIESFPVSNHIQSLFTKASPWLRPTRVSFSPSTYQISAVTNQLCFPATLLAFDIQSSKALLQEEDYITSTGSSFSPNGSLLVSSRGQGNVFVWEYAPEQGYTLQTKLLFQEHSQDSLEGYQLSPSSSMILMSSKDHLEVQHLEGPRPNPPEENKHYAIFVNSNTHIITASGSGSTFTITNLEKSSSQCIDTKFKVHGLAVTGNILLVQGEDVVAGWQLTKQGTVDTVLDNKRGEHDGRIWTKQVPSTKHIWLSTYDCIGAIKASQNFIYYYNVETGVELDPITASIPLYSLFSWKDFSFYGPWPLSSPYCHLFHNTYQDILSMDNKPWFHEGWVKHPGGKHQHQFWLPPEWRHDWVGSYWVENVSTLVFEIYKHPPVIIKL